MKVYAQVEINSQGILKKIEEVRSAETKLRIAMDELSEMLSTLTITEKGDSEESPH